MASPSSAWRRCSPARDLASFWANIRAGVDAITEVPASRWDPVFFDPDAKAADRFTANRGGFVDDLATFDPLAFGIMPVAMGSAEPDQLLALATAAAALADAGQPHERVDPARVGVILGRGGYIGDGVARLDQRVRTAQQLVESLRTLVPGIDEDRLAQVKAEFQDQLGPERPEGAIGLVPNLAASRIANRFDLRGPAYTVDAACASSLIAVEQAVDQLRSGRADVVLAGGVHHCHDLTLWSVFSQLRALSPTGAIRPFSEAADGILVGEGTGVLVLKRLADAERDGDRTYAVIRGTGVASDGSGATLMSPAPAGQVLAVEQAWRASGLDPASVGLIEAHGTATPVGDRVELDTLRQVFGGADGSRPRAGLGSVKSMIGHAMPAAGAAGLIKAALAVFHGELPPTLHVDEPNLAVADTRFRLIGEVEPWEGAGPRVAGVNAFGFGGINAHVVLEEPPGLRARAAAPARTRSDGDAAADPTEEVLLLAGADAADLLAQLEAWAPTGDASVRVPTGGPARLAVVAPNERRLQLARKVLERGTAFRGRNDVWFDPDGLVSGGGKVAFLFPGVEPVFDPHVDDVAATFGLDWEGLPAGGSDLEVQGRGIVSVGRLLHEALGRIGVHADAIAGHSLGEWTGQIASGMIPASYVEAFLATLRPGSIEVSDVVFLALGAGVEAAEALVEGLADAHVSHDNCPHQSVVCAPAAVVPTLVERAKAAKVLAQELPFRSGFHSPLFAPYVAGMAEHFGAIPLVPATVPLWSATAVAPYPDDPASITELSGRHLVEPVRFRELTDRLHAEGVRAFVQVGIGSLTGFVDDTLHDHDVLTVSANTAKQTGLGQLRRVAAALWSAGVDVDLAPLGHRVVHPAAEVNHAPLPLALGSSLVRGLTALDLGPAHAAAPTAPAPGALGDGLAALAGLGDDALLAEYRAALGEAAAAADQVLGAAQQGRRVVRRTRPAAAPAPIVATPAAPTPPAPLGPAAVAPGEGPPSHETVHALGVVAQPHWRDHSFYEQPEGWPCLEDTFPLVPMTAIIELLAAEAEALAPGQVTVAIESVRAFKWLAVEPPVAVTVRAVLDGEVGAHEGGTTVARSSIDRHARAQIRLAPSYPPAPAPAARPVTGELALPVSVERLYAERHLFHGPEYQGIRSFTAFGTDGVAGRLESQPAPGALLDNAGQLFGFWMASAVEKDRLVLPTSIDRISFYGPHPAPGVAVDCVVNLTSLTDQAVRADLELTVDGQVWCRIEGWEDRRFQSDDCLFLLLRKPQELLLAEPRDGGWVLVREGWPDSASRDVVMRRFLGQAERADYASRNPNVQRSWLLGRIAAKDAVRRLLWERGSGPIFPVEVHVASDGEGRPVVDGPGDLDLRVSIAHTAGYGAAIAAVGVPVGIDIEVVKPRSETFESLTLTSAERALLATGDPGDRDLDLARWWAAKEAASKAAGTGLQGRPRDWEVVEVDGPRVRIGDRWIATEAAEVPTADGGQELLVVAWTETTTSETDDPDTDEADREQDR
ncbi:polyketide synthase dehydratase domain-containing protein [Aquihabitans sp. G128]|uniref:type I polyketide synthase n=1 Tax=Aquihabitans sp. G128 TaxID=2849779 RepID=UPI001C2106F1|nr:type I polyketide synthase [Aquihabitans sp. G128]QXC59428.1 polyketide synthase dehydratase domain-containing protein [Aquihabitans sp. G128]